MPPSREFRITVDLGEELHTKLKAFLAKRPGASMADLVREFVAIGADRYGRRTRIEGVVAGGVCEECRRAPDDGVLLALSFAGSEGRARNACRACYARHLELGVWTRDD